MLSVETNLFTSSSNPYSPGVSPVGKFGSLSIDAENIEVLVAGKSVRLRKMEFKLLQYLFQNRGRLATRENLLDAVWGYGAFVTTRTVDTHIKQLRKKLGTAGSYIETLHGWGYRFKGSVLS